MFLHPERHEIRTRHIFMPYKTKEKVWNVTRPTNIELGEDNLWWKTIFNGKRPSVKTIFKWKMTFGVRRPSVEDDLQWKMTLGGRQPSVGRQPQWKMTFGGRRPSVEDNLQWKMTFGGSLHASYSALWHFWTDKWDCNKSTILFRVYLSSGGNFWCLWNYWFNFNN